MLIALYAGPLICNILWKCYCRRFWANRGRGRVGMELFFRMYRYNKSQKVTVTSVVSVTWPRGPVNWLPCPGNRLSMFVSALITKHVWHSCDHDRLCYVYYCVCVICCNPHKRGCIVVQLFPNCGEINMFKPSMCGSVTAHVYMVKRQNLLGCELYNKQVYNTNNWI